MKTPDDNRSSAKKRRIDRRVAGVVVAVCAVVLAFAVPLWLNAHPAVLAPSNPNPIGQTSAQSISPDETLSGNVDSAIEEPGEALPAIISNGEDGIPIEHEAGTVLVRLVEGVSADDVNAALAQLDCVKPVSISEDDVLFGYVELPLTEGTAIPDAMEQLQKLPAVQESQPNYVYRTGDDDATGLMTAGSSDFITAVAQAINDPYYTTDNNDIRQWNLDSIKALEAWDVVKTNGRVTVAVFDTGCYSMHEDLHHNIVNLSDVTKDSGIGDLKGHGTHVCGIIAAEANNGKGIAGVSYNAGLLPVQVFSSAWTGGYTNTSTLVAAYKYLITNGPMYNVRVVNMSIGATVSDKAELESRDSDKALHNAVSTARDVGILTVCSVGNGANDVVDENVGTLRGPYLNFPSDSLADCALTVISLEKDGDGVKRAAYSNYNAPGEATKEISAPGSMIVSTYPSVESPYAWMSGTSMASPCVAGVAALVFAANPDYTPDQVEDILCNNTTHLGGGTGFNAEYGYGEVNAEKAVKAVGAFLDGKSYLLANGSEEQRRCKMTPIGGVGSGTWTFSSSDEGVATVDSATGVVTAVGSGQTVITATQEPATSEAESTTVSRKVTVFTIYYTGPTEVYEGEYIDLTFHEDPTNGMWLIDSTNPQAIDAECINDQITRVKGLKQTNDYVYVTATLSSNMDLQISYGVKVLPARIDLSKAKVSMAGWTYDGKAHEPAVSVTVDGKVIPSEDYDISYENNVNAGTCTATITPKDTTKYRNKGTGTCTVSPRPVTLTSGSASKTYDGKALTSSAVTATGSGFVVGEASNWHAIGAITNVGSVKNAITFTTGLNYKAGNYIITKNEGTLQVKAASLSNAVVTPKTKSYPYDGMAKKPDVTVTLNGKMLTNNTDYTVSYGNNINPGTATITVSAKSKGNYTGSKSANFSIVKSPTTWNRIWGTKALDTMKAIVDAGGWPRGGTVVLVTDGGFYDGLTANGVAGLAGAPIVMTNGKTFSSQARSVISSLRPSSIIVCGGSLAVTDSVVSAARSAAGTSPKITRLWGQHADDTAVAIFRQGTSVAGGSWSSTAFVCTDKGYWDALSAAPISYVAHMPIFLTTGNGARLSSSTVSAMKAGGIKRVYIVGGELAVAPVVASQLKSAGITVADRLWGQTAVDTSMKVAKFGLSQGLTANGMGIATANGYWDALAGAALCGRKGAVIALVNGPGASTISGFVKPNSSLIASGYVFGGTAAVSAATYNALPK